MKYLISLALALAAVGAVIAYAQVQTQPITPPNDGGGYYGGYPVYTHSSTAAEGRLRGMGDLVRSAGQANLSNSAAAVNYSVARSNQIQNRDQWTSTYFNMRETNRRARAAERGPRPTMEDAVRYAQAGMPKPLSPGELNPITGKISWPRFLQTDEYGANRAKLERIFAYRASSGAIGPEDYMKTRQTVDTMLADLKKQIREIPPMQYMSARKFLQSLKYEIDRPVG